LTAFTDGGGEAVRFGMQCAAHAIRGRFLYPAAQPLDVQLSDAQFSARLAEVLVAFVSAPSRGPRHR